MSLGFESLKVGGLKWVASYLQSLEIPLFPQSYFRGHASTDWKLQASVFRPGTVGITRIAELSAWQQTARRFFPGGLHGPLEYLVLAQHFGIATNLLDWTTNPLIALFFACQSDAGDVDGVVIQITGTALDVEGLSAEEILYREKQPPLIIDTSTMNIRSTAQDSVMSLHGPDEPPLDGKAVFRVPHTAKNEILHALTLFGITPERVYADLGVAAVQFRDALHIQHQIREAFQRAGSTPLPPQV
ncbi:FRG domain-containing protein [Novosphingobium sp. KA1]|uniref:FRG domain-containing protein n=1 Tax=Novosphingobium sp. (strain KA1) TaxID=164608 RepID=UPI001A8DAEDE|nr:FRG domain-containing protein [Novosphingobium sp. KA1]QSR16045.1 hypothetical protein CA833_02340 [Novosphingobium sp. KA1]